MPAVQLSVLPPIPTRTGRRSLISLNVEGYKTGLLRYVYFIANDEPVPDPLLAKLPEEAQAKTRRPRASCRIVVSFSGTATLRACVVRRLQFTTQPSNDAAFIPAFNVPRRPADVSGAVTIRRIIVAVRLLTTYFNILSSGVDIFDLSSHDLVSAARVCQPSFLPNLATKLLLRLPVPDRLQPVFTSNTPYHAPLHICHQAGASVW